MKPWLHRIEVIIDASIPHLLVLLAVVLLIEFFFLNIAARYHFWIEFIHYLIVGVFIGDLSFKYNRIRKFGPFLWKYWLDVIAVFPFVLIYRVFFEARLVGDAVIQSQRIVQQGIEIERAGVGIVKEVELAGKYARTHHFAHMMAPLLRLPRFFKAAVFFERPVMGHHR